MTRVTWLCRSWDTVRQNMRVEEFVGDDAEARSRRMAKYLKAYHSDSKDVMVVRRTTKVTVKEEAYPA